MAKGLTIEFDSGAKKTTITFYPLTLKLITEDLAEDISVLRDVDREDPFNKERFDKLIRIFTASAQRGNPHVTEADVRDVVDLGNLADVSRAVLGQSGFRQISAEEAAAPTSPRNGGASTPAS